MRPHAWRLFHDEIVAIAQKYTQTSAALKEVRSRPEARFDGCSRARKFTSWKNHESPENKASDVLFTSRIIAQNPIQIDDIWRGLRLRVSDKKTSRTKAKFARNPKPETRNKKQETRNKKHFQTERKANEHAKTENTYPLRRKVRGPTVQNQNPYWG